MAWQEVYSSRVDAWDYVDGALLVRWKGGKTSVYRGVPPEKASEVMNSASVGKALKADIEGEYAHEYLEE